MLGSTLASRLIVSAARSVVTRKRPLLPRCNSTTLSHRYCTVKSATPLTAQSFRDPKVFSGRSTQQLFFNYAILRSCSITPLVAAGTAMLNLLGSINMSAPAHWVVEKTYFKHFVAGRDLSESIKTAEKLSKTGISTILDYSIESADGNVDEVVDVLVESIRLSGKEAYMPFSCFKVTALTQPHLLLRVNEILRYQRLHPEFEAAAGLIAAIQSKNIVEAVQNMIEVSKKREASSRSSTSVSSKLPQTGTSAIPEALTTFELETMLLPLAKRLQRLGDAALEHNQAVLVDAEHWFYQETIHWAAKWLMTRYNTKRPLFYNTYQMYLKSSPAKLQEDLEYAKKHQLIMGAKLVRGAYMEGEAKYAKEKGTEMPIWPNIQETHKAYNAAVSTMLNEVKNGTGAVVVASHNEQSALLASQGVHDRQIPSNHPFVHFGQLYGMCDHISLALTQHGHNVVKYVPFGPVAEVMPYLLRRVAENKGFLSSTHTEQELMLANLNSRFSSSAPSHGKPQPQL